MARRPADDAGVRAALRDPVLRVQFAGQAISATGSWMNHVALGWLALKLTGSALAIGVVMARAHDPDLHSLAARRCDRGPLRTGATHERVPVLVRVPGVAVACLYRYAHDSSTDTGGPR